MYSLLPDPLEWGKYLSGEQEMQLSQLIKALCEAAYGKENN